MHGSQVVYLIGRSIVRGRVGGVHCEGEGGWGPL